MHIVVVGLNYRTAPVEIREKLTFSPTEITDAMQKLQHKKSILENVIISTCNRTEIYAVVDQIHTGRYYIKEFLSEWFGLPKEDFAPYLFIYEKDYATNHLFQVASGLNSMILGETQILGQVRTSFLEAQAKGTTGTIFNSLFKRVITLAKRGHAETEIGSNAVSISYAAVELAKKIFGSLDQKHILILGAGKMGELAIQNLHANGASKVTVINRTYEKAQNLADKYDGSAKTIQELQCSLVETDILISSTGANNFVIDKELMNHVVKMRKGKPLFIVDIAVPRDIDPNVAQLEGMFLYDIDDLQEIVQTNLQERRNAAKVIELMIEKEIVEFNEWVNMLGVVPLISALREKSVAIQEETMESIKRRIPDLSERDVRVLNKLTKSIVNQMIKDPILQVKELAGSKNAEQSLELFKQIFALQEIVTAPQKEVIKEENIVMLPNFSSQTM